MAALTLYRGLTSAGFPVIRIMLRRRMARGKEDRERFSERLGVASRPRPEGRLLWFHAASVGEAQSVLILIKRLMELSPKLNVLVTTGTVTSARLMADRLPKGAIHQYAPVDRGAWVGLFLDHWRPDAALWVESEFWPNMVTEIVRRDIPLALVNGRMSARSHKNWMRLRGMARQLLSSFRPVLAQDETIARRLADLGAREITVTGNLKYAADPLPHDPREAERLAATIGDRPRWVAASTHDGEEVLVVTAHRLAVKVSPQLLTIIVPRHPSRGDQLAGEMRRGGLDIAQRSRGEEITPKTQIYLADTLGELGLFYRLTDLVFVGGSLVPRGCQNLLEPAQLDCAILHGPDTSNFEAVAADLEAGGGAVRVADQRELSHQVAVMLADKARRDEFARGAAKVAADKLEVIDTVIAALAPVLKELDIQAGLADEVDHAGA